MKLIHLSALHLGKRVGEASMQDAHGAVDIYLLSFVKPLHVAHFFVMKEQRKTCEAIVWRASSLTYRM